MKPDILKPISPARLAEYIEVCRNNYPKTIRAFNYLINQTQWLQKRNDPQNQDKFISNQCWVEFYAPRGADINNCTFIALAKPEPDFTLFIYTLQDSLEELTKALMETRRINWDLRPVISSTESHHMPALYDTFQRLNISIGLDIPHVFMVLPKEEARKIKYDAPEDVYVRMLRVEDAHTVDDLWPHKHATSWKYITSLILLNGGFGVYAKENDELLSWVLINDHMVPGMLQTKDSAKRKGYGKLAMQAISKYLAEEYDLDSIVFIKKINVASRALFERLDFKVAGTCNWVFMSLTSMDQLNH